MGRGWRRAGGRLEDRTVAFVPTNQLFPNVIQGGEKDRTMESEKRKKNLGVFFRFVWLRASFYYYERSK
jgi:hypothetical protein